jgi:sarcosine oxidase, subunit beta
MLVPDRGRHRRHTPSSNTAGQDEGVDMGNAVDVVVIGGGLVGLSAAWALASRGAGSVLVLERDTLGSGGTGKSSGVVRCHYGVSSLAAMAARSLPVFEQAEEIFGMDIGFRQVGYVVGVGEPNVGAMRASLAAQREVGVDTREIGVDEVAAMWPAAELTDFAAFGYEPRGGYGDAYLTAQAFSRAARQAGATVRQHAPVAGIDVSEGRAVGVRLSDGSRLSAGQIVVAAGPWSVPLVAEHGIEVPITVHRESVLMVRAGTDLGPVPVFSDLVSLQYLRPDVGDTVLFGDSDLSELEPADPDEYRNSASAEAIETAAEKIAHRLPGLPDAGISHTYAGCYDVTPDFNPVISATTVDGVWVAAGFSGHGFKISPAVGWLVADLVIDGHSNDALVAAEDFRLSRYAEGALLTSPFPYVGAGEMR